MSEIPEMVVRIAQAIQLASSDPFIMPDGAEIHANVCAGAAVVMARAAIAAMMEPTETMVQCGGALSFNPDGRNMDKEARIVFQGMLREALKS